MANEISNHLPEASAALSYVSVAGGYVTGLAVDFVVGHFGDRKREGALSTQGVSENEFRRQRGQRVVEADESIKRPGTVRSIIRHQAIPVSMGLTAGLAVAAWTEAAPDTHTPLPVLGVVVDNSFSAGQDGSAKKAETIAEELARTGKLKLRATIAHNGTHTINPVQISRIGEDDPFGPASLPDAVMASLGKVSDQSAPVKSNAINSSKDKNGGVLVITDGNPIGNIRPVVKSAREQGNVPIFVANISHDSDSTTKDLYQISEQTGGKYWQVKGNTQAIAQDISKTIKPQQIKEVEPDGDKSFLKFLSLVSVALTAGLIKSRGEVRVKGKLRRS